jgi:hypothetical protein
MHYVAKLAAEESFGLSRQVELSRKQQNGAHQIDARRFQLRLPH